MRQPDAGGEKLTAQVDGDPGVLDRCQGHGVGVHTRIALLLPPVGIEALSEVALPVEKAHSDHRHPQAAGRLEVVPGQYPEPPRVLGERLGYAELG